MKAFARKLLNRAGFDVVRLRNSNATLATNLANVLRERGIRCVLDVGANAGQYGVFLRELGYRGHILSFEPVRAVFERLEAAARGDGAWRCFPYALGDEDARREINVYKSTVFSSFLDANEYSKGIWQSLNDRQVEVVEVKTLDDVFAGLMRDIGDVRCMLKMDTQGYDLNVFRGAARSLASIDVLQSEIAGIRLYENMPDGLDMLKLYQEHGYFVSGMFPINREQDSLAAIEFDCLLVRRARR